MPIKVLGFRELLNKNLSERICQFKIGVSQIIQSYHILFMDTNTVFWTTF